MIVIDVSQGIIGSPHDQQCLSDGSITLISKAKRLVEARELAIEALYDGGDVGIIQGEACLDDSIARLWILSGQLVDEVGTE